MHKTLHQDPDELFEVYDLQGKRTGLAKRSEVHGNPDLIHRVAHVLLMNSRGELYLQKRSPNKDVLPGRWDCSVGGHVNPKESWDCAAERELTEELGISAEEAGLTLIHLFDHLWRTETESEQVRTYALLYDGPITPSPEEISEGRFWKIKDIGRASGDDQFTPVLLEELKMYRRWIKLSGGSA